VVSVRQILCLNALCNRLFYLCPWCDRGDWYCAACKRPRGRSARHEIAQRYWQGHEGKIVTAVRLKRWRKEQLAKNVTDPGTEEVGPSPMLASPADSRLTSRVASAGEEKSHGVLSATLRN
jgi:hypothetical protein